jgi:putative flippase GtrA
MIRWLKFNAVGAMGIAVQLAALALFKSGLHVNYMAATAVAVELAVLHNFVWHERWTWRDRGTEGRIGRLVRFHLANGLVSIAVNLVLMRVFVGQMHWPYLLANMAAIAVGSVVNFLAGDLLVFRRTALLGRGVEAARAGASCRVPGRRPQAALRG